MASSTSQELSQESDELKASYFTHHLVSALRGAGDADGDGRVSLDEAYRYAYRRTLASTARTRIGEQHVTLETDLAGQGDVPVTYHAEARAQLELPAGLEARVLVQHRASGAVVAEVQKSRGEVRLAFVAGAYDAVVAQGSAIVQCSLVLSDDRVTPLDPSACAPVSAGPTATKGDESDDPHERPAFPPPRGVRELDRWAIEAAAALVSDDGAWIQNSTGVFHDVARFKAVVTCPASLEATFDVVVLDPDGTSFPLAPARLSCGSAVPIQGAFRLAGAPLETVCLVWDERGAPDRRALAGGISALGEHSLCKQLQAESP
ncbi:MAG TPA: hypothetical protein VGI39_25030 [Polyangiaceae bacterium]|jgi:hypothetical protein